MMHGEAIMNELEEEVVNNGKGCIIFNPMLYLPVRLPSDVILNFSVDVGIQKLSDSRINHRYPNKGYWTITKKYGRRLSKIGYPYYIDLSDKPRKLLITVNFGINDDVIRFSFPLEVTLTKDKPVCSLEIRVIYEKGEFALTYYDGSPKDGWKSHTIYGIMKGSTFDVDGVETMGVPGIHVDTTTLFFKRVVKPVPHRIEDLMV